MAKRKLRWIYPPQEEMHTIEVNDIHNIGLNGITELRPCQYGINEQGEVVKTLYCTRDGRFFVRYEDGWHEQKLNFSPCSQNYKRGSVYPIMRHFGNKRCHVLVAYAWLGPRPEGYEIDHLNGDKLNWSADNLEYVTREENRRRSKILKRLRKMAIDPKWVYIRNLKGLYKLTAHALEEFFTLLEARMLNDDSQLTIEAINEHIAETLDICYTTI